MDKKTYITITSALLLIVALLHVARLLFSWEISVGGWMAPAWVSWAAVIVAGFLSYSGFMLGKRG